ncbi:MAG: hypothetical protein U0800_02935 [Isosphaeraceae bacterium]
MVSAPPAGLPGRGATSLLGLAATLERRAEAPTIQRLVTSIGRFHPLLRRRPAWPSGALRPSACRDGRLAFIEWVELGPRASSAFHQVSSVSPFKEPDKAASWGIVEAWRNLDCFGRQRIRRLVAEGLAAWPWDARTRARAY